MARWAKALMCGNGTRVPWLAQTSLRRRIAGFAVGSGTTPRTTCAPRPGTASTRRSSSSTSVFVSRVCLNPRPTCWCCSEQERCIFGSAGRVPFDLWPFALLPVVRWKTRHRPSVGLVLPVGLYTGLLSGVTSALTSVAAWASLGPVSALMANIQSMTAALLFLLFVGDARCLLANATFAGGLP
jgi:hypothetical protein